MGTFDFLALGFQSSFGKRKIFSKKKNIEAVNVKLEHILSCEEIPVVRLKSYAINAFVVGYYVYKENWIPSITDELQRLMEPTIKLDKYAVAVREKDGDVMAIAHLGSQENLQRQFSIFWSLTKTIIVK